jgi:hypothetical protein
MPISSPPSPPASPPPPPAVTNCVTGTHVYWSEIQLPPGSSVGQPFCVITPVAYCCNADGPASGSTDMSGQQMGQAGGTCVVARILQFTPIYLPAGYRWSKKKVCVPDCSPVIYYSGLPDCCGVDTVFPDYVCMRLFTTAPGLSQWAGSQVPYNPSNYPLRYVIADDGTQLGGYLNFFVFPGGYVVGMSIGCHGGDVGNVQDVGLWAAAGPTVGPTGNQVKCFDLAANSINPAFTDLLIFQDVFATKVTNCQPFSYQNSPGSREVPSTFTCYAYPPTIVDAPGATGTDFLHIDVKPSDQVPCPGRYPTSDCGIMDGYPDLLVTLYVPLGGTSPVPPGTYRLTYDGKGWKLVYAVSFGVEQGLYVWFGSTTRPTTARYDGWVTLSGGTWQFSRLEFPPTTYTCTYLTCDPFSIKWQDGFGSLVASATLDGPPPPPGSPPPPPPPVLPPPPGVPPLPGSGYITGATIEFTQIPGAIPTGASTATRNPVGCCGSPSPGSGGPSPPCPPTLGTSGTLTVGGSSGTGTWIELNPNYFYYQVVIHGVCYEPAYVPSRGVYILSAYTNAPACEGPYDQWLGTTTSCGPPIEVVYTNGATLVT